MTEASQDCSILGSNSDRNASRRVLNMYVLKSVTSVKAPLASRKAEHRPGYGKEICLLMGLSGENTGNF